MSQQNQDTQFKNDFSKEPLNQGEIPNDNADNADQQPKDKKNRKLLLFILLALLGILLGFLIFSLAGRKKHVPPPPPKRPPPPPPKKAPKPVYDHCRQYEQDKEEAFGKFKVLVADFQELHEIGEFEATAGAELVKNGFGYKIIDDEEDFVEDASQFDIVWIISSHEFDDDDDYQTYLRTTDKLFGEKKSFYIWADNSPYTVHANIFLERHFDGMRLSGNYRGQEVLQGTKGQLSAGKFDQKHYVGCHLNEFYEGNTICTPTNIHKDFKVFAYSSNGDPAILIAEANERHGRIIVDCGFTKLYKAFWDGSQNDQLTANANLWLTGIPK